MTVILFLIILGALIFVHELGHFISAKRAGIRVDAFALGFPPRLFSKKIGETVYALNLIPFGGYVKIYGENGEDTDLTQNEANTEQARKQEDTDLTQNEANTEQARKQEDTDKDIERRFTSKSRWVQALVLSSGVLGNLIFAWLLISISFMSGIPSSVEGRYKDAVTESRLTITSVLPDSPAHLAGLKSGDAVLYLEEGTRRFQGEDAQEARSFIADTEEQLTVLYKRGDQTRTILLVPQEGIVSGKKAIGVTLDQVGLVRFGFFRAIFEGFLTTVDLVREVATGLFHFLVDAFKGDADLGAVTGPVGIAGLVGEARVLGIIYLLSFTAFISINLAVINLLPIPALDGGRLFFLLIEGITRRAIPARITRVLNTAGFILLILLMVAITYRDVVKFFS